MFPYFLIVMYMQFLTYGYLHFFTVNWAVNQVGSVVIVKTDHIFIPLAIVMSGVMGLEGVLWAGPVADALAFVLAMILVIYELKKMKGAEA